MKPSTTEEIVRLCLEIDKGARDAYGKLSLIAVNEELQRFWRQMSEEEQSHVDFWQRALTSAGRYGLPRVFADPDAIRAELAGIIPKASELLGRCSEADRTAEAFALAYRLEFYLLHPAFETLYQLLRRAAGDPCPEDEYQAHINRFVDMLAKIGHTTPELELLGETLHRLWNENKALAERASTEALTGLMTRQAFWEIASHLAYLAHRQNTTVGVLMIDVDRFKSINDTHGHLVGDSVLTKVAEVAKSEIRTADLGARYGGDEFVVFMPDTSTDIAPTVGERIRGAVAATRPRGLTVTVSIGVATGAFAEDPRGELVELVGRADTCLCEAKRQGGNRVVSGCYAPPTCTEPTN
jgi:diguanylate cyclase (GGDEF)-like protein